MSREDAYEVAIKMFQLEAERWAKNALGLLASIVAVFGVFTQLKWLQLSWSWPFLLASILSGAGVLIALSIRGTTDAWKDTVKFLESPQAESVFGPDRFEPYRLFESYLDPDRPWEDFKWIVPWPWRFWNRDWRRDVLLSVTRLYTLLFATAAVLFLFAAVRYSGDIGKMKPLFNLAMGALYQWQAVIAITASFSVWVLFYQTRQQRKFEAYWNLYQQWSSPEMRATRRRAAALLQQRDYLTKPELVTVDISDVLDFFDTLAMLVQKSVVDKRPAWHQFYWWAVNYWYACEEYVGRVRTTEGPRTWEGVESLVPKLMKQEGQSQPPSPASRAEFLEEESKLPS